MDIRGRRDPACNSRSSERPCPSPDTPVPIPTTMFCQARMPTVPISAARSAYSIRSCPQSSRSSRAASMVSHLMLPTEHGWMPAISRSSTAREPDGLRHPATPTMTRGAVSGMRPDLSNRVVDLAADGVMARRCQRDKTSEEPVLDQVLAGFFTNETNEQTLHADSPCADLFDVTELPRAGARHVANVCRRL